jgi:hypothetical protein
MKASHVTVPLKHDDLGIVEVLCPIWLCGPQE